MADKPKPTVVYIGMVKKTKWSWAHLGINLDEHKWVEIPARDAPQPPEKKSP